MEPPSRNGETGNDTDSDSISVTAQKDFQKDSSKMGERPFTDDRDRFADCHPEAQ